MKLNLLLRKRLPAGQRRILDARPDRARHRWTNRPTRRVRLVLADSQELIRVGLRTMFAGDRGLSVRGEAGTFAQTLTEIRRVRPDLVLLDYHLPGWSGEASCRLLREACPKMRILMLTRDNKLAVFRDAMRAGVHGLVHKDLGRAELIRIIRLVAEGQSHFNSQILKQARNRPYRDDMRHRHSVLDPLSPQEGRILPLIAEGRINRDIARELGLAERTVKNYIANMFKKLQISRRAQAAAYFLQGCSGGARWRDPLRDEEEGVWRACLS